MTFSFLAVESPLSVVANFFHDAFGFEIALFTTSFSPRNVPTTHDFSLS